MSSLSLNNFQRRSNTKFHRNLVSNFENEMRGQTDENDPIPPYYLLTERPRNRIKVTSSGMHIRGSILDSGDAARPTVGLFQRPTQRVS